MRRRPGLSPYFRRFERFIGIDRRGRSTWVWAFPVAVGLIAGAISPFTPGLPNVFGMFGTIFLATFAFVTMTVISVLYMVAFDRDRNQVGDQDTTWSGRPVRR